MLGGLVKMFEIMLLVFAVAFLLGFVGAFADPGGTWAPWQVGVMIGVIAAGIVFGVGLVVVLCDYSDF